MSLEKSAVEMIKGAEEKAITTPDPKMPAILDGFEFVPSDGVQFITLDNQRRFYLNASARKLLGVKPYQTVSIMYRVTDQALAVVKPEAVQGAHANTSVYTIDKRYYLSARKFADMHAYAPDRAPYEFVYDRGSSDGSVFIFRLATG